MSEQVKESAQCPGCGSSETRKHGKHLGKQRYYCKRCGLAFTGEAYHYRPAQEVSGLKEENHRLLKIAEAAGRLNAALDAYLKKNSGKALSNLNAKRERLARLLAEGRCLENPAAENGLTDETETSPGTQAGLF
jgi:ribosomal protein L37AE/L43A